jgi:hypothetical protein
LEARLPTIACRFEAVSCRHRICGTNRPSAAGSMRRQQPHGSLLLRVSKLASYTAPVCKFSNTGGTQCATPVDGSSFLFSELLLFSLMAAPFIPGLHIPGFCPPPMPWPTTASRLLPGKRNGQSFHPAQGSPQRARKESRALDTLRALSVLLSAIRAQADPALLAAGSSAVTCSTEMALIGRHRCVQARAACKAISQARSKSPRRRKRRP